METERKVFYRKAAISSFVLIALVFLLAMLYTDSGFTCIGDPFGFHFGGCGKYQDSCLMSAGMSCTSSHLSAETSKLDITLVNGMQKRIVITQIACSKKINQLDEIAKTTLANGGAASFSVSCKDENGNPLTFQRGKMYSGKINAEYYFEDEGPDAIRRIGGQIWVYAR